MLINENDIYYFYYYSKYISYNIYIYNQNHLCYYLGGDFFYSVSFLAPLIYVGKSY